MLATVLLLVSSAAWAPPLSNPRLAPQRARARISVAAAAADRPADDRPADDDDVSQSRRELRREMLAIGVPALAGLSIDPIASLVDTAMIGRFCTASDLAGAGVAVSIFNLISRMFNFLNSATTSAVAAASDEETPAGSFNFAMTQQASAALAVAVIGGSLLAVALISGSGALLGALGLTSSASVGTLVRRSGASNPDGRWRADCLAAASPCAPSRSWIDACARRRRRDATWPRARSRRRPC